MNLVKKVSEEKDSCYIQYKLSPVIHINNITKESYVPLTSIIGASHYMDEDMRKLW